MKSELESDVCYSGRHLLKATEVTADQAKNNGSLPPGDGLVTCRLTVCTLGSAPGPEFGNSGVFRGDY